jgi:predicted ribosome quality control (RQC) complex YloA/Tae2 family protein
LPPFPPDHKESGEVAAWLRRSIAPMSPLVAADLAAAIAGGEAAGEVLGRFREAWASGRFAPRTGRWQGRPVITPFSPAHLALTEPSDWPTLAAAVQAWLALPAGSGARDEHSELAGPIRRGEKKLRIRLDKLAAEEAESGTGEGWQRWGELLLANRQRLQRGLGAGTVDDYYCVPPQPVTIPLDPQRTPQDNVERCFLMARKARRRIDHLLRRREETEAELEWLATVDQALAEARTPGELLTLRQELEEFGLIRALPGAAHRRRAPSPRDQLRQAVSPGGFELRWGRNNRSNDYLCRELLGPDDLWFHAHGLPGCHLALKRGGFAGEIPPADLLFAAALAAGCSRGKDAVSVEVMIAEGRHVHKPKGARPGLVTVSHYRTLRVAPQSGGVSPWEEGKP